jgi:adenine-specific DNA-methyltransferase
MQLSLFPEPEVQMQLSDQSRIVIQCADTAEFVQTLPANMVKLIITSPPYNLGKAYETRVGLQTYLQQQQPILAELVRVLHPNGSLCWQVGNYVAEGEVFPLDIYYYELFKELGLQLRNRIIWYFGHGLHAQKRFSGRYETILWFTKSADYTFELDPVRVPAKYPGKRHFKGDKKGELSGNPLGKNPSDVWEFVAQEWDNELWDIPNVKANHPEKTIHPCQYPIELVERCLLALTHEDDLIFDPFMGVGSALIAGLKHNRRVMGCDKEAAYVAIAKQRVTDFYHGRLKLRPLGTTVYKPTGREKVAQIPDEWKKE